jgi:hypothetical protein
MTYEKNGKRYAIPNEEIEKLQAKLKIPFGEAVEVWLTDHDLEENEEQVLLNKKASAVAREKVSGEKKADRKPRTVKISDEKQALFKHILDELSENFDNVQVLKENKLIEVGIGGKIFKIDIIEQRPKKA